MDMMYTRFFMWSWTYGIVRNAFVLPKMKPDELYTERLVVMGLVTLVTPVWLPFIVASDIANLERKLRGLKTTEPVIPFF